jgi:hypothetical protein
MKTLYSLLTLLLCGVSASGARRTSTKHAISFHDTFHRAVSLLETTVAGGTSTIPTSTADAGKKRGLKKGGKRMSKMSKGSSKQSSKMSKGSSKQISKLMPSSSCDVCDSALAQCKGDASNPKLLYVQVANHCTLSRSGGKYTLSTTDMDDDTYVFSDRPFRAETVVNTKDFFADFNNAFTESTGGNPNAAVTLVHEDDNQFEGPLVSVFIDAAYSMDSGTYTYQVEQSEDQQAILSLESFFEGGEEDSIFYSDCSFFIDTVTSGYFYLYSNKNYGGSSVRYFTPTYAQKSIYAINDNDSASSAQWNIPDGRVVTVMDDNVNSFGEIHNTRTLDFINSGTYGNLKDQGVNDVMSAFTVYDYDTDMGYVELFEDSNYGKLKVHIFLSEYDAGELVDIGDWWLNDRISSIKWDNMNELVKLTFYQNGDGSGRSYPIMGWDNTTEAGDLGNMNDKISSFKWSYEVPQKEVIDDIVTDVSTLTSKQFAFGKSSVTDCISGTNSFPTTQVFTAETDDTTSRTVSSTVTDTLVFGWSVSTTVSYTPDAETGGAGASVTLGFSGSDSTENSKTDTNEESYTLSESQSISVPGSSDFTACWTTSVGELDITKYVNATRWYTYPISDSVVDPEFNNWYKRVEVLTVAVKGGVVFDTKLNTNSSLIV